MKGRLEEEWEVVNGKGSGKISGMERLNPFLVPFIYFSSVRIL
jgi:hypothetical protein